VILFGVVLFLPAATLVLLGVRLLDQDRAIATQRQGELLERAADQGVHALERDLAELKKRLTHPPCAPTDVPEDAVCFVLRSERFEAIPPQRIPYYPLAPGLKEPPSAPFRELEAQEFADPPDLVKAFDISQRLAGSEDPLIRVGARLRQARLLRAMSRPNDALAAYDNLSRVRSVSINGEPADLLARRARCAVLEEQSRVRELRQEAEALTADLRAGRWQLDRATYFYVSELLSRWLGSEVKPGEEEEALAIGAGWLYKKWTGGGMEEPPSSGFQVVQYNGKPVTIAWASDSSGGSAFVAGPRFLRTHWLAVLRKATAPAQAYMAGVEEAPRPNERRVQRTAADTGLPWTVVVAGDARVIPVEFQARRRNLFGGMAAVLVLVAAGSYFLWRSVNRDLSVVRLQSDFVSAVSHEFRTPLTALRQFNDLLAEEDGPTPEKRRRYYEAQARATGRLHRLVESLLDFARMEAGRRPYNAERLDAGGLAREVIEEFRLEADRAGFQVSCNVDSDDCTVSADREALSRALWNLLDNAVKYSGTSREVEVEVRRTENVVSIAVRDRGIGIAAAEQKRIFEKFVRGTTAGTTGIRGTGLGLAMVRHIVTAHGGTVNVRSAMGESSTFTILLPARRSA
jgi:signal transduction histidine kinase